MNYVHNCIIVQDRFLAICNQGEAHPHLVAFTPRGHLLSYSQAQPNIIKIWPEVESLWPLPDIESKENLKIEDVNKIDR